MENQLLSNWDYIVIVFYLVFMMCIGFVCKHLSKDSSDYFRSGGKMVWWISGMSGLAAAWSAWGFTAGGAEAYRSGFFVFIVCTIGSIPNLIVYFFLADKFRQMRVVTACDAIKRRYGAAAEQFWVWIAIPTGLIFGGLGLYMIAVFMSKATGMDVRLSCTLMMLTITIMAMSGGSWAVAVSDFIQMMIILLITIVIFFKVFALSEIGGLAGFIDKMPSEYHDFSELSRPGIWITFLLLNFFSALMSSFDINGQGSRYLYVKNGNHAKKSAIIMTVGAFAYPWIVLIPVFAVQMLDLNLVQTMGAENPGQGAYLALAHYLLPQGMMGLMACAIFAAAMSSFDTALNKNAGFIVKNFYAEFVKPNAPESHYLMVGRIFTLVFGFAVLGVSLVFARNPETDLFTLGMKMGVLLVVPMVIPMALGILVKRTPGWAAWSTALIGLVAAYVSQNLSQISAFIGKGVALITKNPLMVDKCTIDVTWIASCFGATGLSVSETGHVGYITSAAITMGTATAWYFFTMRFYDSSPQRHKDSVEAFFKDINTPLPEDNSEESVSGEREQYTLMAGLLNIFGIVLALGALIPNALTGRMLFIVSAYVFILLAVILKALARKVGDRSKKVFDKRVAVTFFAGLLMITAAYQVCDVYTRYGVMTASSVTESSSRVLLVSGTIGTGYQPMVQSQLQNSASVDLWVNPTSTASKKYKKELRKVLKEGQYDVVCLDVVTPFAEVESLSSLVDMVKSESGDASVFFCTAAPAHSKSLPEPKEEDVIKGDSDGVIYTEKEDVLCEVCGGVIDENLQITLDLNSALNPRLLKLNEALTEYCQEQGVTVIDLYGLMIDRTHMGAVGSHMKWRKAGYEVMGIEIGAAVKAQIK